MKNIFEDKNGKIVIGEKPNLPIIVWFIALIASKIPTLPIVENLASLVAFGAIFTWAWMEIFDGTNTWRRILGIIVMAIILTLRV